MATKTITFSLNAGSIERAAKEVEKFAQELHDKIGELIERLTQEGQNVARVQVTSMGAVDTGDLLDSIYGYYNEETRTGFIFAGSFHAVYVEYGTGIVGARSAQHPEMSGEWEPPVVTWGEHTYSRYDTYAHGDKGWWYPAPFGWYIPKDGSGARLAWTKGMRARPFMYQTFKELERLSADIFNELFSGR